MTERERELLHDMHVIAAMRPEKVQEETRNDVIARIAVEHARSAIRLFERYKVAK